MAQTKTTTDHETIRRWVQARNGRPAHVRSTSFREEPGVLRIQFDSRKDSFESISWEDFFEEFEERNLAFQYREESGGGEQPPFYQFVERESNT